MPRFDFKLPDVGEGIAEAEIVAWHVRPGEWIAEDEPLADIMTDKATVALESPVSGTVVEVAGEVGERLAIGSVLAVIETEAAAEAEVPLGDGTVEPTEAMEERLPVTDVEPPSNPPSLPSEVQGRAADGMKRAPASLGTNGTGRFLAAPAVRKRAKELGIDLAEVKPAGERVRHSDLDAFLLRGGAGQAADLPARASDQTIPITGLRRRIAERMADAKRRIPHFTLVEEVDVTALEQLREMLNRDGGEQPRLTLLPFLIAALTRSVADWPMLNATFDDQAMTVSRHGAVHVGVATQTPAGLMVPVLRDADRKTLRQLGAEIARLAEAARSATIAAGDLSGSTITVSSLGPLGGIASTPIVNPPEVAIVAVNRIDERPAIVDGELEVRKRMNLSLSCDHRVIDGWEAASFLQAMKTLIENPLRLLPA